MAVNLDESSFFKFVIISDKPKSSKNKFTEKPSRDRDIMSTNSTNSSPTPPTPTLPTTTPPAPTPPTTTLPTPTPPTPIPPTPPNNEKLDEKKQNSQETNKQTAPEVKLSNTPNSNGESTKEQKNEESTQITIEAPSKSTSPQLVTSPREIAGAKIPEPSITSTAQNSNIFKSVGKKFGIMKNSSENGTVSDQEVVTSNSKTQQERQNVDNNVSNNSTENTVNAARSSYDENQKEDKDKKVTPETTAAKKKNSIANMKSFITRTSSVFVEKIQEKFDNLDRHIYPDIDPNYENKQLSREVGTSEREQLLENKDVEIKNGTSQVSQTTQSTQNVLAEVGVALNERKEKLDSIGEKTEKLSNSSSNFLEIAKQISKEQEQKNSKFWKLW